MKRFDCIFFDLGDTLVYFAGDSWGRMLAEGNRQLGQALVQAGLELDREAFVAAFTERMEAYYAQREREFIEHTTGYVLRSLLAEWGHPAAPPELLRQALAAMYTASQQYWQLEAETLPLLQTLQQQGYRLGIISNAADDQNVQDQVDAYGMRPYFELVLSSAAAGYRKPNPRIFRLALERMGVAAERSVMVGDTLGADILGANQSGLFSVWLTRRADKPANRDHLDTIQPAAVIANLSELPLLLKNV